MTHLEDVPASETGFKYWWRQPETGQPRSTSATKTSSRIAPGEVDLQKTLYAYSFLGL